MPPKFNNASGNLANNNGDIYKSIDAAIKEMTGGLGVQDLADRNRLYEPDVNNKVYGRHVFNFDPDFDVPGEYTERTESIIKDMCAPGLFYFDPKEGNRARFIRVEVDGKPLAFSTFRNDLLFGNESRLLNGKDVRLVISEPLDYGKGKNDIKELLDDIVKTAEDELPVLEEPKMPTGYDEPVPPKDPEMPEPLGFWSSLWSGFLGIFGIKSEAQDDYDFYMDRYTKDTASFDDRMLAYYKQKARWEKEVKPVYEEKLAEYKQQLADFNEKTGELTYNKDYIADFKKATQKISEHVAYFSKHADEKQKLFENTRDLEKNIDMEAFKEKFGDFEDKHDSFTYASFQDEIKKLAEEDATLYEAVNTVAKRGVNEPGNLADIFAAYKKNVEDAFEDYDNTKAMDIAGAFKEAALRGSLEERLNIALSEENLYGVEVDPKTLVDDNDLISKFTKDIKAAAKASPKVANMVLAIGAKNPEERGSMKQYFDAYKADPKLDMGQFLAEIAKQHEQEKNVSEKSREIMDLSEVIADKTSSIGQGPL